ncbi:MAG: TatD family hydrolase, partial [Candidatus Latescibacteria bacterium]|nr:TatD family hydrolase [Candidatus Latescibacterota bacterium]
LETDCPFLAPVPKRGKRNEPAYVRFVAEYLAQHGNLSFDRICEQTTANATSLFGLGASCEG